MISHIFNAPVCLLVLWGIEKSEKKKQSVSVSVSDDECTGWNT